MHLVEEDGHQTKPKSPSAYLLAGFGFVKASDGSDAFLHARVLEAAGHRSVTPGANLKVRLGQGLKGPQVMEVFAVDASTAQVQSSYSFRLETPAGGHEGEADGVVKWYNAEKAFGFVVLDMAARMFSCMLPQLRKSGLALLKEGQKVTVSFVSGKKGPEAKSIRLRES